MADLKRVGLRLLTAIKASYSNQFKSIQINSNQIKSIQIFKSIQIKSIQIKSNQTKSSPDLNANCLEN